MRDTNDEVLTTLLERYGPTQLVAVLERLLRQAKAAASSGVPSASDEERLTESVERFSENFTGTTPQEMIKGWRAFSRNNPGATLEDFLGAPLLR